MRIGKIALALVAAVSLAAGAAHAADPAAARIEAFDELLLSTMKAGPSLGAHGRYQRYLPHMTEAFNIPVMTSFAVGPAWAHMTEAEKASLTSAFARLSAAKYAHNFDKFDGERFVIDPNVPERGGDKIVQTKLIPGHGAPVPLAYRMRLTGGSWKIIDVYYNAVSQLTTQRSEFAASLEKGGAKGLESHLQALTDRLLAK